MTPRHSYVAILAVVVTLMGCGQKTAKTDEPTAMPAASAPAPTAPQQQRAPAESASAPTPKAVAASPPMAQPGPAPAPPSIADFTDEPALKDVFFDPGRADIGRAGARLMRGNARWMVENPGYLILIEGHTDNKGTRESNLAIAERRAKAAASALVKDGVPGTRMWTVSHGSDRPVCAEKTEACAAKNRRVHFRVMKQ
jgi:outer membrane protein OmpA-like peptidoglycan-associated protein